MVTNVISVEEFNVRSGKDWPPVPCKFFGIIPGYICGFNVEAEKDGKISAGSCCFTNDFEEIENDYFNCKYNDLGISAELMSCNGWEATGNIVFRGYYTSVWDFEEREDAFIDSSDEVMKAYNKYVVCEV